MKVYSYIITHDSGFSPNLFHGVLTLACCKPMIRRSAEVGEVVVGLSIRAGRQPIPRGRTGGEGARDIPEGL